jgi:hypothetical protein
MQRFVQMLLLSQHQNSQSQKKRSKSSLVTSLQKRRGNNKGNILVDHFERRHHGRGDSFRQI